jgi:CBS domain-containing protein
MAVMTRSRCRHIPVVLSGGQLCGLVSIGDVVKHRLEELELETTVLRDRYLVGR